MIWGGCGLDVPESSPKTFSKVGSTFQVKQFDRNGRLRIHFASAMTLLRKTDRASAADGSSYLDLAAFIYPPAMKSQADDSLGSRPLVYSSGLSPKESSFSSSSRSVSMSSPSLFPTFFS
ncbi:MULTISPECIES: HipA domain-containing protein [Eubacteriales]|uniref:HipA domain-containing protein n=1 Tax=Eubacteriales TaxID=186802 RepID=UPI002E2361C6